MNTYFRLLSFGRPLGRFLVPFVLTSLLAALFATVNFALLIPLLNVLFNQSKLADFQSANPRPESLLDGVGWFNYYFSYFFHQYGQVGTLKFVCAMVVSSVLLSNLFKYLSARQLENFKARMVATLRESVFSQTLRLHLGYFSDQRKGTLISHITTDVQEVEGSIANTLSAASKEVFTLVFFLITLFTISTKLTLVAFLVIPVSGGVIAMLVRRMKRDATQGQQRLSGLMSVLDETFGGMRVVKGFNAESFIVGKFQEENNGYRQAIRALANRRELASPFSEFMGVAVLSGILLYGGSLVLSGQSDLSASAFVTYLALFSQVTRPAKDISNAFSASQRGLVSGKRVLDLMDTQPAITDKPNAYQLTDFQHEIAFEHVSFSYETGTPVLKDISFTLQKGKTIALVGSSGGGKSTLADLVPRFYDPTAGQVRIDGHDLRDCQTASLRNLMGIVTQESILFNDSVFNNIAFGSNASAADVEQAARIANAHEFISQMPNGYHTTIGDRGSKLSGGQRQRISIARAVLRNPPILILDEATSALDTESERLVQEALTRLMANRTTLVIAHRLSTIQHADEILVINQGRIVERGRHDELLLLNEGVYRRLQTMQQV
ncbi:ABC transporter related protein [Fibrella aestuarina BUZ 2]|uniref:ABC transporter related protein n=1 Tax=Fibrella aestuarina BUZ 2 TaxID=1166018 RepID=I0K4A1_9BACT|nr:ABC transporter ATP-binding protein [Fibrella aestuarina]CCG98954.1 ABC transporter related protein [Fibrella aestuarina BUZ 2]